MWVDSAKRKKSYNFGFFLDEKAALGVVHKLCRLKGGGVKNCQKRQLRGGGGGQKSPILRRHSL